MENITIGQIISAITGLTIIVGFFVAIFKWYKKNITDRFNELEERVEALELKEVDYRKVAQDSKDERFVLLKGLLACLKGLSEQGCNGPVTEEIKNIEDYLLDKTHDKKVRRCSK